MGARDIVISEDGVPRPGPLGATLALAAVVLYLGLGAQAAFGTSYVVDTTSDASLTACTVGEDDCSLRGAIINAGGNAGADTITFDPAVFPPGAPTAILLGSPLPVLSAGNDTIDGVGAGVIMQGTSVPDALPCLSISSSGNTITRIRSRQCNRSIDVSGDNNIIGPGNVLSTRSGGFQNFVIRLQATADSNIVKGNLIGTNATGTAVEGDAFGAIAVQGTNNLIGGTTAADRNVVAVKGRAIRLSNSGNVVKGNYIGTDITGTFALACQTGVQIFAGATGNTIGGATQGDRNVISGCNAQGVNIRDTGTTGNVVKGNFIGTNAAGSAAIANGTGVSILAEAQNNTIGGSTPAERNVISGNQLDGVVIFGASGNVVKGNYIGANAAGTTGLPNQIGVRVDSSSNNIIGGILAGEGNTMAFNTRDGVCITQDGSGNSVRGNSIYSNGFLGIDLDATSPCPTGTVTPNDAGDGDSGPNDLMNFPVITYAAYDGVVTTISGTLDSGAPGPVQIDLYASNIEDPSGHGEGRVYLDSLTPSFGAWTLTMIGQPPFPILTATATDAGGNTSEFSEGIFLTSGQPPGEPIITQGPVAGTTAPGTNGGTFGNQFDLDINSDGAAVFANTVTGGSATSGVFLFFAGSAADDIAVQGLAAPGGGTFSNFGPPINNDNDQIVGRATTSGGPGEGLFLFFAGSPTTGCPAGSVAASPGWCAQKAAAVGDETGPGTALFFAGFAEPTINNVGQIAANATITGPSEGLFLFFAGQPTTQALAGDAAPGGGTFLFFAGNPAINNAGRIAQKVELSGGTDQGLYLFFAGQPVSTAQKMAKTNDPVPGGGTFLFFAGSPAINNDGRVVALADYTDVTQKKGLFLFFAGSPSDCVASGGAFVSTGWCAQKLADLTTSPPGSIGGAFTGFSAPTLTDGVNPQVVARATVSGGSATEGLFLFVAGSPVKTVVAQGDDVPNTDPDDTFDGGPPVFPFHAMNNGAQVVYVGNILGNAATTQGVFIASLDVDNDSILDFQDNCPALTNTDQRNTDQALNAAGATVTGDGLGNSCDSDDDNDQFSDALEALSLTNPVDNCPVGPGSGGDSWSPDVNIDGSVTGFDLNAIAADIGKNVPPAPARRNIAPDPPDGAITGGDLQAVASRIGRVCA